MQDFGREGEGGEEL